jgi:prepilin-type N-terminal cleavage/methylation domain-containing protein
MKKIFLKTKRGYTIIETMIAVSLFLVVVTIGMGALLNANLLHQKSQSLRSIMDNLSFVMEDMSRNLRTGYHFQCFDYSAGQQTLSLDSITTLASPRSCPKGWAIAFESAGGNPNSFLDQWAYYISNSGQIYKTTDGARTFIQLTPDEVFIDANGKSSFSVLGAESKASDSQQPYITIRLVGTITYKPGTSNSVVTPFSLQSSVSQRLIDI